MTYNLTDREKQILQTLSDDSSISVTTISQQLGVSAVTIRNDLNSLVEKGFIVRTHGGAFPAFHPNIIDRQKSMIREKEKIARAAALLVKDGDQIMVSAGTTTSLIPRFLLGKRDVHMVTNSTFILLYTRINPALRVTFVGGEFRPETESMAGSIAIRELEQFYVKMAFIGTDGFSMKNGITAHSAELAEVVKKMTERAEQVILVADSTKFGKTGFAHILPLNGINKIITDGNNIDEKTIKDLKKNGIEVVTV